MEQSQRHPSRPSTASDSNVASVQLAATSRETVSLSDVLIDESRQRYQSLFDHNPDAVMAFDVDGHFISANLACERLSGYTVDELLQMSFHPLIHAEDTARALKEFRMALHGSATDYQCRIHAKNGSVAHVRVTNIPITVNHVIVGVFGVAKDMTEQVTSRLLLTGQKRLLEWIATGHSMIEILHHLSELVKSQYPESVCSILRYEEDGRTLLHLAGQLPPAEFFKEWDACQDESSKKELTFQTAQGMAKCMTRPMAYTNGEIMGLCVLHVPQSHQLDGRENELLDTATHIAALAIERKETERQVRQLAYYDPLTSLPNRRLFLERIQSAWEYAVKAQGRFAVMFMDMDRFKSINDSLGHAVGDHILRVVGSRLQESLRIEDTVARLGGDEFTVLLPDISDEFQVIGAARKMLSIIDSPIQHEGHEFRLTTSIGIAIYPDHGEDVERLLRNADVALYDAKKHGKNNFKQYRADMNEKLYERLILENALRRGLEHGEFHLHFQPRVHLKTGRVTSAEALLRWSSPTLGVVSPADFIPIAEETGLIIPIGNWVLETVCKQIRAWEDEGFSPVRIAVNVSAREFHHGLIDSVQSALTKFHVNPHYLEIEITETTLMQSEEEATETLAALKIMGIHVSIDDFGRGYSSLGFLQHFPIDALKIDQMFIREISTGNGAIVTAIVTLAHSLNLLVVAEGVEREDQLSFLQERECDEMQGYLFSRPIPPQEFVSFLSRKS